MERTRRAVAGVLALSLMLTPPLGIAAPKASRPATPASERAPHVAGELLVKLTLGAARQQRPDLGNDVLAVQAFRVPKKLATQEIARWRLVKVNKNQDLRRARGRLLKNPNVEAVEYNFIRKASAIPNDPSFGNLWGLHNTGQTAGTYDADIDAPEAWDLAFDGGASMPEPVLVGVIDSGVDHTHPDLGPIMWRNPGEIAGNGIDDDGNGYIDDIHGWDFVSNDADPMDDNGHGTHVAGTIHAMHGNGIGVAGVAPNAMIMALRFLDGAGYGSDSGAISAVLYATHMGARITNNSWGGGAYNQALYDAIAAAAASDSLFIAAAGNETMNTDEVASYPAGYNLPNIVSVAATDHNDGLAYFSNYGATSVDLAAPGVDIYSTMPGAGYANMSGTSMASPHVAGVAALIRGKFPALGYAAVRDRLLGSVDQLPQLAGKTATGGRLNAYNALDTDVHPPAPVSDLLVAGTTATSLDVAWSGTGDDGLAGEATRYEVRYAPYPLDSSNYQSASVLPVAAVGLAGTPHFAKLSGLSPTTTYHVLVQAFDNMGNPSPLSNVAIGTTEAAAVLFQDDVEQATVSWELSAGAIWHRTTNHYNSPITAWHYAVEGKGTYNTGTTNSGSLTTPMISLAGIANPALQFSYTLQTEQSDYYDIAQVQISTDGVSYAPIWTGSDVAQMTTVLLDLAPYQGQSIKIRFHFDTKDGAINDFQGWVVDDVIVFGSASQDPVAPAPVMDLAASWNSQIVELNWTATGDDDMSGAASRYDIRYLLNEPIDPSSFERAVQLEGEPMPAPAGMPEHFAVPLPGPGVYHFAMKVIDEAGNESLLSNPAVVEVQSNRVTLFRDNFESGSQAWSFYGSDGIGGDGLWHISSHRAHEGSSVLYYGKPDTLNYDTGARNYGTATSKPIDLFGVWDAKLTFIDARSGEMGGYDVSVVEVSTDGGATWTQVYQAGYSDGTFAPRSVDLAAFDGQLIQIRFRFDTIDQGANAYEGWLVDEVSVTGASANGGNLPPVANPGGPYAAAPGVLIPFNGTGSYDPEGSQLQYHWSFGDGATAMGATPQHSYAAAGSYPVTLTVFDGQLEHSASTTVSVGNQPPKAVVKGPSSLARHQVGTFDGSGSSDPEGSPLSYEWHLGGSVIATGPMPSYAFPAPGTHVLTLMVFDGSLGAASEHSVTVTNTAPLASFTGPAQVYRNDTATFTSTATDADGDALLHTWKVDGAAVGGGQSLSYTFTSLKTHLVELQVSDGYDTHASTMYVTVNNRAPVAAISGPNTAYKNQTVLFDAGGSSDADGDPLAFSWSVNGAYAGNGKTLSQVFKAAGQHTVVVTASDGASASSASLTVSVPNRAPLASFTAPAQVQRNQAVRLDGSASYDPDADGLTYSWTANGVSIGNGAVSFEHAFTTSGSYTVTLTVSDGTASDTVSQTITVTNSAPSASISGPNMANRVDPVTFVANAQDADGDVLSYLWKLNGQTVGTASSLTHKFSILGANNLELYVADGDGQTVVKQTVVVENLGPSANAGPDQNVAQGATVTLDGAASSDPDGGINGYFWKQIAGPSVSLYSAGASKVSFKAPKVRGWEIVALTFELTVVDSDGASASDQVIVHVSRE
jgi:subtilisin family serine protease/PKD repeat protein